MQMDHSPRAQTAGHVGVIGSTSSMMMMMASENRAPPSLPKALESMLKTTTETGNIGIFSIKPPRLPPPLNSPRRTGGTYSKAMQQMPGQLENEPRGMPDRVDDRKRLPSYTREGSSEVIFMFENASQKSCNSRDFGEPDHRSYSMTQASSLSSHTLSNHRSYTSLRSQAENNKVRPISPFAYPSRLKRPGFRPSSPALTDGGLKDYSRRAEIGRPSLDDRYNSASPASFYAGRRVPQPLSIRSELNKPNLPSRTSPTRRATSPLQRSVTPANDWGGRSGPASNVTTPARSTYSLSSTVNFYTTTQAPSTATTPVKVPPSPLYYDYTEEFDNEQLKDRTVLEPPPAFQIAKSIPEDRPLSSSESNVNYKLPDEFSALDADASPFYITPTPSAYLLHKDLSTPPEAHKEQETMGAAPGMRGSSLSFSQSSAAQNAHQASSASTSIPPLSTETRQTFTLPLSSVDNVDSIVELERINADKGVTNLGRVSDAMPLHPSRIPAYGVSSALPTFPIIPLGHQIQAQGVDAGSGKTGSSVNGHIAPATVSKNNAGFTSDPGMAVVAATKENETRQRVEQGKVYPTKSASLSDDARILKQLAIPVSKSQNVAANQEQLRSKAIPYFTTSSTASEYHLGTLPGESEVSLTSGARDLPNFSHQIPRRSVSRSGTPMLAPKPISPARQAKLKNSVPQLMKALPPLPLETQHRPLPPSKESSEPGIQLPFRIQEKGFGARRSPRIKEAKVYHNINAFGDMSPTDVGHRFSKQHQFAVELDSLEVYHHASDRTGRDKLVISEENSLSLPTKKKLKMKGPVPRPTSPPGSRPWNLEESYPWSNHDPALRLQSLVLDIKPPRPLKPPKFKLKITRASNSTLGTVRVHQTSSDSKRVKGFQLSQPKDLFTPAADGLESIFRKVSRSLNVRRTSLASTTQSLHSELMRQTSTPDALQIAPELCPPQTPTPSLAPPFSPTEVRSFFSDDSSHRGGHSLRKRLSYFRARMGAPYSSRAMSQSLDDNAFRQQMTEQPPPAAMSNTALNSQKELSNEERSWDTRVQARKVKAKVSQWFKGAQTVLKRAKARAQKK